jgi:catechol 2,3-dioxygenase-like lactoylglutathione lyase family enzyme
MTPEVQSMFAASYVEDIDASRAFYGLLGFREQLAGKAPTAAWSVLRQGGHNLLLASTRPPLRIPRLPLLFYFFYDDVDAMAALLTAAAVESTHMGYPPHALGGEVKLADPDGNTVLIGQRERSDSQPPPPGGAPAPSFSLLKEAAALVAADGGAAASCEVRDLQGTACAKNAEVKLADSWGDTAWACLSHAGEILVSVRGAFIANKGDQGIAGFLSGRRRS